MKPSDVRSKVLADHEKLRHSIGAVASIAGAIAAGDDQNLDGLRLRTRVLDRELRAHLDLEDRHLLPVVLECAGEEAAEAIAREHAEQRALFAYVLGRLADERRPSLLLARELQTFAELLLDDMQHEERGILADPEIWDGLPQAVEVRAGQSAWSGKDETARR